MAAIDREHADWLQPLVESTLCGFDVDYNRPEFLTIHAQSITEMMDLAEAILAKAAHDPPPPLRWGSPSDEEQTADDHIEVDGQQSLFDH
ncbi:hypothetical protein QLQ12_11610 [Actinoplanes sp. NEAU-A12]|uniref:Uncharacterized protein n=1 Tax=Actinoplanes sandaracinus TaxID=3045177 RepID=A0ABT6WHP7_9ACTN|nr:hypothetical protein [Actinoplanes sandaracinus]MDI6099241.1 hypothetical protein [Actinoplanes sandaracinus]